MIKKILLLFFLFSTISIFSQNQKKIDSLESEIKNYKLNDTSKINLYISLCKEYNIFNPTKQFENAEKANLLSKKIKFEKGLALSLLAKARAKNDMGDYDLANKFVNESIRILSKLKENKYLGDGYFCLAQSYIYKSNIPESLIYLNKATFYHEKAKDYMGLARDYNNYSVVYMKQNKDSDALQYLNKIISLLKQHKSKEGDRFVNLVNSNIGVIYRRQKKYDESISIFKKCLIIDSLSNRPAGVAYNKINIGDSYLQKKEPLNAIKYLNGAIVLFTQMENKSALGDCYRYLGNSYFLLEDYSKAIFYVKKGLELSISIGELESMKFGYELLAQIYEKSNNYKLAVENQKLFKKISDSMINSDINNKVVEIQMTHEFEKKQEKLKQEQSKRDSLLKEEAEKQKNIKYSFFAAFLVMCFIAIAVYFNLKQKQKQNKIINEQKELVEKQNDLIRNSLEEKEILLREIHHRVKNNLQTISSLLSIQADEVDDEKILSSLNEGQSRVQAMSLIHQNLYQSEHISAIDIDNYFKDLVSYLAQMHLNENKNIKTNITTEKIEFDIDTAIPIGLIVNELVSNAFKYAFANKNEGNIWVTITTINHQTYELKVEDDGVGLPTNFEIKSVKSLGLSLVKMLTRQLQGNFTLSSISGKTKFVIQFKDQKASKQLN